MSMIRRHTHALVNAMHALRICCSVSRCCCVDRTGYDNPIREREFGGANRDRTDDLKLAKLALSQLSYGPVVWDRYRPALASLVAAPAFVSSLALANES